MSSTAVVVLGHGSRSPEATEQFVQVASLLAPRLPHMTVLPAFMELAEPSLPDAIERAVALGAERIIVLPCFLFLGNHIKHDIPKKLARAEEAHPGVRFEMREPIGTDARIVEALLDRLGFTAEKVWGHRLPDEIEAESMRVIDESLSGSWTDAERAVVRRLVHASGDVSLQAVVGFSDGAVEAGVEALAGGADVVTDVRMVEAGVDSRRLAALGGKTLCMIDDPVVAAGAAAAGTTRAVAAMRALEGELAGAVVAVGNAPTALRELIALAEQGVRPALVIGMPVGFVDAAESKAALEASGLPYVTVRGARGGSPLAAAAVNALLRLAQDRREASGA